MRMPRTRAAHVLHGVRIGWCILLVYAERVAFYRAAAACGRHIAPGGSSAALDVLIIADPQVIDRGTYDYAWPLYRLARLVSDVYLRKAWLALTARGLGTSLFRPRWGHDLVVFLGDMSDRGRWRHDRRSWTRLQARWERIFSGTALVESLGRAGLARRAPGAPIPALVVPGNHDIGLPGRDGRTRKEHADASEFFRERYGAHINGTDHMLDAASHTVSWNVRIPISTDGATQTHEIVLINALDLIGMEPRGTHMDDAALADARRHAPDTASLVDALAADVQQRRGIPRILFSHVPLARGPDEHSCTVPWRTAHHGVRRESQRARVPGGDILQGGGIDNTYQNLIEPHVSAWVLRAIAPAVVFSGDDHDHCEAVHRGVRAAARGDGGVPGFAAADTPELTVKSLSMLEGVHRPGYARLRLYAPHAAAAPAALDYAPCLLPDQINIWLFVYLPCLVVTLALLAAMRLRSSGHLLPLADEIPLDGTPMRARRQRSTAAAIARDIVFVGAAPLALWVCIQLLS